MGAFEREIKRLVSKARDNIKLINFSGGHLKRHYESSSEGI